MHCNRHYVLTVWWQVSNTFTRALLSSQTELIWLFYVGQPVELDDLVNLTRITFKSGMCFIEWQDGPHSLAKIMLDNHFQQRCKMFLTSHFDVFNGQLILQTHGVLLKTYIFLFLLLSSASALPSVSLKIIAFLVFLSLVISNFRLNVSLHKGCTTGGTCSLMWTLTGTPFAFLHH